MAIQRQHFMLFFLMLLPFLLRTCVVGAQGNPLNFINFHNDGKLKDSTKLKREFPRVRKLAEDAGASHSSQTFNVNDFGAKVDGTDDSQAFLKAWKKACSSKGATLVIPKNNYFLKPITFSGPCASGITVQIMGTLEAYDDPSVYDDRHWIEFDSVQGLVVEGGGVIDGNGKKWWQNSCKVNKNLPCKEAPTALTFYQCKNLIVRELKVQDAQQMHIVFEKCNDARVSGLTVTAPGDSPNTDGIHVTGTQKIQISNTAIATGDDCISIETGTKQLLATGITCGPGHGISIGSLGDDNSEAQVSDITIKGAKLSGTMNGVRIKTYQGGSGSASDIVFQNIEMENVQNPIIIDQFYCDEDKACKEQRSAVQVKNVLYEDIKGTSATDVAVKFDCSKTHPCQGIKMVDVSLKGADKAAAKAECNNIELAEAEDVSPKCP